MTSPDNRTFVERRTANVDGLELSFSSRVFIWL